MSDFDGKIRDITEQIVREYQPEKVILFGSAARGGVDEYSDYDWIIVKKTDKRFIERLTEPAVLQIPGDVFVYTPEEFRQMQEDENPFIESALRDSKILYSR